MPNQNSSIQTINSAISDLINVLDTMDQIPGMSDGKNQDYKNQCLAMPGLIDSGRVKIAVVGVIKSGKSTFINSLIGKELVKRGAGVTTSITTRIRKGKKNRAVITFKSWDEINAILGKTLDMFPLEQEGQGIETKSFSKDLNHLDFDIRRKNDRFALNQVYERLSREFPVTDTGFRPEALVIKNALAGYDFCKDCVGADPEVICFESRTFDSHKAFTSDQAKAFYVKDVLLEVFGKAVDPNIEIADCQGADSTDPAQLAQIVQYIESANLIVYCISSRNGLRQSDIGFLKLIKRLGLFENIVFLNNCDLTEHENLMDLKSIESRIIEELALFSVTPKLYSFSALFDLFLAGGSRLAKKNRIRLQAWKEEGQMAKHSLENSRQFHHDFSQRLGQQHFNLLISNHLERLEIMIHTLDKKASMSIEVLGSDHHGQEKVRQWINHIHENGLRLQSIVDNSVEGAVSGLKKEIKDHLKSVFARDAIHIRRKLRDFIRHAPIDPSPYRHMLRESGFKHILYLMFQDFKLKLDRFIVEQIQPDIKIMVRQQEERIETYFQSLLDSYRIDILKHGPMEDKENATGYGQKLLKTDIESPVSIDMGAIKKILGLELPSSLFSPRYSKRLKANIITGLSIQSLVLLITSMVNKKIHFSFTPGFNRAAAGIKKDSLISVQHQIDSYHNALLDQYFMPLIQAVTRDFKDKIHDRFSMYASLNRDMEDLLSLRKQEKKEQEDKIKDIRKTLARIRQTLESIKALPESKPELA